MIPDCYIGVVSDCNVCTTPSSGLFLNGIMGLPGITLKSAAAAADSEIRSGTILLQKAIDQALLQTKHDLKIELLGLYTWLSVIDQTTYGEFTDTFIPASAGEKGLVITIPDECKYARICIQNVTVKVDNFVGTKFFKIVDGDTETSFGVGITDTDAVTVETNYQSNNKEISILWDTVDIDYNDSNAHDIFHEQRELIRITGSPSLTSTFGLQPKIQVVCDPELLLCDLEKVIAYAVRFRAGANVMMEVLNTDRVNPIVECSKENAQRNLEMWTGVYLANGAFIPGEYQKHMKQIIKTLPKRVDQCSCCFECDAARIEWADMFKK